MSRRGYVRWLPPRKPSPRWRERWDEPKDDEPCVSWARAFFDATAPFSNGGVYVNFISEGEERVAAAYGENHERLARVKKRYDPENLFRVNQNVAPAART